MTILLIEDDPLMYKLYQRILEHAQYQVIVATNAIDGFALAKSKQPQLVLLDIMMPKQNGIELLKQLKAESLTKDIPVVMLSNLGTDNVINEAFQLGANGYIVKSQTSNNELLEQIKKYI